MRAIPLLATTAHCAGVSMAAAIQEAFTLSGPLTLGAAGELFGTTDGRGTTSLGTVFELRPPSAAGKPWRESVIYNFTGGSDGASPHGGVATAGAQWTKIVLYSFNGAGGSYPLAGPVMSKSGSLYRTTTDGGNGCSGACGMAFSLMP